jgi:hypothetical protein
LKEVTRLMINEFKIQELGHDFMGYSLQKGDIYTFHHLIVPNRHGGPYARWNGAILFSTPHQYLHTIENVDDKYFYYLTSEMVDINVKGFLDERNIDAIHDILCEFEHKYDKMYSKKGKRLIKPEYLHRIRNGGK